MPRNKPQKDLDRLRGNKKSKEEHIEELALAGEFCCEACVDEALAEVDVEAEYDAELDRWEWSVWDRVSPINGVPAAKVIAKRKDIAQAIKNQSNIYMLHDADTGHVSVLQPHEPEVQGFVWVADPEKSSNEQLHGIAESRAFGKQGAVMREKTRIHREAEAHVRAEKAVGRQIARPARNPDEDAKFEAKLAAERKKQKAENLPGPPNR